MKTLILTAVAVAMPFAALAHDGMHVEDAYARSANPMTGAIFMTLENHRDVACTLQGVESDVAERVELHSHTQEDGIMKMGRIEGGIQVPAQQSHALERGGDHVMLLGLTRKLSDGDQVALTLDFGDCGREEATAVVDNARADAGHDMGQMDHGGDHAGH
ncbi:copper chaperone PCu(A)C [Paracoccus sediminilitoris]|uniref:copper chaperone PCu(A)C n=1 Tax=Paracoccus sediminilitoris TaxID=2202419 RepID=UPI00272C0A43|nr:copper chaperone PCu(A)C [Paracoccus sediminilitoris]